MSDERFENGNSSYGGYNGYGGGDSRDDRYSDGGYVSPNQEPLNSGYEARPDYSESTQTSDNYSSTGGYSVSSYSGNDYSGNSYSGGSNSSGYSANGYSGNAGSYSGNGYSGNAGGSSDSAGGRYYSYGNDKKGSGGSASSGGRKAKKNRGRLAGVLAVILVFILGAGAGAYMSGRGGTVSPEKTEAVESQEKSSIETEKAPKEEKKEGTSDSSKNEEAAGQQEKEQAGISTEERTISRVGDEAVGGDSDNVVADVAQKVMPAIVSVYNKYTQEGNFFGRPYTQEAESTGSGIIIEETKDELLIVTNNHVVEGAESLSVQFINEENCEAAIKGTDADSDLAVISVSLSNLSAETKKQIAIAEMGDSDTLRIGEQAIAIGNALGYGQSLTVGYVSALNREITSENGVTGTFIQTDAAINPGNSGGALLNSKGQVIGINSNKIGGSTIEGMGFAIPISKAIPIINELKLQESRTKVAEEDQGALGIKGISVTSRVSSAYGLPEGAYVEEIIEGSGAAASDLEAGDIITAVNGQTIGSMEDLSNQLAYYAAGTEVTLTVQHPSEGRSYEEREIKVTLSKRSDIESSTGQNPRDRQQQQQQQQDPYSGYEDDSGYFFNPFGF